MKRILTVSLWAAAVVSQLGASTVGVKFNSANGQTDSAGYLISPYYATVAGVDTTIYCDDFANEVHYGQQWAANVTNLGSADLSKTRYGGVSQTFDGTTYTGAQLYSMVAYLTTQFTPNGSQNGDIQDTIWDIFNPNQGDPNVNPPQPSSSYWLHQAEANYSSVNLSDFRVLTNTNVKLTGAGQVQEFIFTPEPSSTLLLGIGLVGISIFARRGMKLKKVRQS